MKEDDLTLIERFIDGDLSEEELKNLEEKVSNSPGFSEELTFQKNVLAYTEAIAKSERKKKMLAEFRAMDTDDENKVRPMFSKLWYAAASLVLLLGVFFVYNFSIPTAEDVFASYYQPYDGIITTRDDSTSKIPGIISYYRQEYETALEVFLKLDSIPRISGSQRNLLIANCYLNLDLPDKSLVWLNQINDPESKLIKDNRDWYIALSMIKNEQVPEARKVLENLVSSDTLYIQKAKNLLNEKIFD